jgi:hypothetical protein
MGNHAANIRATDGAGKSVVARGRNHIIFDLGNGQKKYVSTIDPLHLRGSETEIDTAWVADTGAWQWKLASTDYQAHARSVFNAGNLYEWRKGEHWIIVDPQSINWVNQDYSRQQIAIKQAVTGVASDATLTFTNAYGAGKHFSYTAHPRRLIKHFTIDSLSDLPAPTVTGDIKFEAEFTISTSRGLDLYLDGVKWAKTKGVRVRTANQIDFRDASNTPLWYADPPIATDANGEVCPAEYEVRRQGGPRSLFITVRVPREWMVAAAYPVKVDPTFTDGYGGDVTTAKDTYIKSTAATTNYGASATLDINTGKALLEFDLSSIDSGATCDSATFYMYKATSGGNNQDTVTIYSIASGNAGWPEGTKTPGTGVAGDCCWNYKEQTPGSETAWAGSAGLSTSGTDYEASSIGSWIQNSGDAAGTEYSAALTTSRVEDWFGGTNTNYGIVLWTTVNLAANASSDSATTGYRPKLVVVYTEGGTTLTVANATLALAADSPALTQKQLLAVANASLSLTADNVALVPKYTLVVADASLALSAESPALTQKQLLAVADAALALTADNVALTQKQLLAVDDAALALTADNVTLSTTNAYTLEVQDAALALTSENVGLTQKQLLAVQDAALALSADNLTLTVAGTYLLTVQDATLALSADSPGLTQKQLLAIDDATLALAADSPALTQKFSLTVADATLGLYADNVALVQAYVLLVASATLALNADNVTLVMEVTDWISLHLHARAAAFTLDTRADDMTLHTRSASLTVETRE